MTATVGCAASKMLNLHSCVIAPGSHISFRHRLLWKQTQRWPSLAFVLILKALDFNELRLKRRDYHARVLSSPYLIFRPIEDKLKIYTK